VCSRHVGIIGNASKNQLVNKIWFSALIYFRTWHSHLISKGISSAYVLANRMNCDYSEKKSGLIEKIVIPSLILKCFPNSYLRLKTSFLYIA
jgi:hypothetical protein